MKPFCSISSGGVDLTGGLSDRLLSVEVTDVAEEKSDSVSITLDDRASFADGAVIGMPVIGQVVNIVMGYVDGAAADKGSYLIDDLSVSSPPRQVVVTGRAAAMNKSFRSPRSQSYHQKTLGDIMQEIAGRNGYSASVDPALAGIVVRHRDQSNESDMAFATRLARDHDAVAKPVDGKIAVVKKGTGKGATGAALPQVVLVESDCKSWTFNYSAREESGEASEDGAASTDTKGGVRAYWTDIRTGEKKAVTAGSEPYSDLRYTYHNEAEATAAVGAKQNEGARGKASFSCEIIGDPMVQAEAILVLSGFRPYIPTMWRITTVRHKIDGKGYSTSIDAELFSASQSDVSNSVKSTSPTDDDKIDPDAPPSAVV